MAQRLSRRKLARYAADGIQKGKTTKVLNDVAAYLLETRRTREIERLVRDIEDVLAERGVVVADVVTARPLTAELKKSIDKLLNVKQLEIRSTVDPDVLGGIRISTPGHLLDATIAHKLTLLRNKQV